jgi:hypothetical protein
MTTAYPQSRDSQIAPIIRSFGTTVSDADGLRRALAPAHRRYAGIIHAERKRTGHFWQGRFGALVMDEDHLAAELRYVSLNPVRARLVARAGVALVERARASAP